ncbi:MAG: hypothetical protein RQ757_02505 [Pseudomonadales bacterium]|nr:hypothetical protein [Pseudomonadales bacterium]
MLSWCKQKSVYAAATGTAAVMLALGSASVLAGERVGDFALLDQQGLFHHMAWYDDHKAIAFLVQANDSEASRAALADFTRLQAQYDAEGIEFMMINPLGEARADVQAAVAAYGTDIPVLIDDAQLISEAMGIDKIGEAFLFDPRSFEVIYRGPAGKPFADALAEVAAGQAVSNAVVATQGPAVSYPAKDQHQAEGVSYSRDVAPILAENCASCHREGGIAPFAMDSHTMVQGWSPMIREVLMTKRMPPGQLDPHVGHFSNDYVLSNEEQQKILHWIAAGSQKDGSSDPLAELTWPESKWAFGEPDMIIKVPPQSIPATGVLDYIGVVVPLELEKDRWVRASQYIAGDRTVLHHTLNAIVEPGQRRPNFLGSSSPNQAHITAYIPGAAPHQEPPNTGGVLKAGSALALQLHYTTTGRETVDESEIGLWFYPEDQIPQERASGSCACIFTPDWTTIPPHDPHFEMTASITIEDDAYLASFLPHMHFRGKSMKWTAEYPDGSTEELINLANYNYNWQMEYKLVEPKFVPGGTRIIATGAFDNSTQNRNNPDPDRAVPWGLQSWDEMFFGAVNWKYVDQSRFVSSSNDD